MNAFTAPRRLTLQDFKDTPSTPAYRSLVKRFLSSEHEYIVVDRDNVDSFISRSRKTGSFIQADNIFFNRVDVAEKRFCFNSCVLFDCELPEGAGFENCKIIASNLKKQSGAFGCSIESLSGGRVVVGDDCYLEDTDVSGARFCKGLIFVSSKANEVKNSHYSSHSTVRGGIHLLNTYDENVVFSTRKSVGSGFDEFCEKAGIEFKEVAERFRTSMSDLADVSLSPYGDAPFIEYPDNINCLKMLACKDEWSINVMHDVMIGWRGKHKKHSEIRGQLLGALKCSPRQDESEAIQNAGRLMSLYRIHQDVGAVVKDMFVERYNKVTRSHQGAVNFSDEVSKQFLLGLGTAYCTNYNDNEALNKAMAQTVEGINDHTPKTDAPVDLAFVRDVFNVVNLAVSKHSGQRYVRIEPEIKQTAENKPC